MNIKLSDNTILNPILVTGGTRRVQGQDRDTLRFIFPGTENMTALDTVFSAENCESITIVEEDGSESIHKAYTIRAEMIKSSVEVTPATDNEPAVYEDRITVAMSQRTYAESKLDSMNRQISMQEECIVELANIVYA